MYKKLFLLFSLLLVSAMLFTACGGGQEEEPEIEPSDVPEATAEPTAEEMDEEMDEMMDEEMDEEMDEMMACEEDLEGETITFYAQAGLTGPLAGILGTAFVNGLNDAANEINAAGGVCGAEIVIDLTDTQYDPEQEIAVYSESRENDPKPFAISTYGSGATIALSPLVNEDHIVNIAAGLNAQAVYVPSDGWTVLVAPIYSDQFAGFLQFVSENWDDIKPEGAGDDIVVGVVGWDNSFGAGATTPNALAYAESIGITVLELETYAIAAEADLVTPLNTLALGGANVIYIQSLGFGTAQAIGTIRGLEMWDSVLVGSVNWGMNGDVLTVLGENAVIMDGMYGVFPYGWWDDDSAGVQQALAAFEAGGYPDTDKVVGYLTSYAGVYNWAAIVELAINTAGFENLNGDSFFDAFKELGIVNVLDIFEWNVEGGNRAPVTAQIRQAQANAEGGINFVVVEDFFLLPDTRPSE